MFYKSIYFFLILQYKIETSLIDVSPHEYGWT
jgi:hypothetical protein